MKKLLIFVLVVTCSSGLIAQELTPVFGSVIPVTLTNANGSTRPRIALVNDSVPLVTWVKTGSGNGIIYCSRWNGTSFDSAVQVSPSGLNVYTSVDEGGSIAAKGDTAYIVFFTLTSECYCVRSFDAGITWSDTVRIDHLDVDHAYTPDVEIDNNGNPVVAFESSDPNMAGTRQYVTRSNDAGASFIPETEAHLAVTGMPCECCPPSLLIKDSMMYVFYRNNNNNQRNIVFTASSDSGATFPVVSELDQTNWILTTCPTAGPEAAFYRDSIVVVWKSSFKIWYACADAQTGAEGPDALLEPALGSSVVQKHPQVLTLGDTVVYIWDDRRNMNTDVYISISGNGPQQVTTPFMFNDTIGVAEFGTQQTPNAAVEGNNVHLVYQDQVMGTVQYRKASITGPVGIAENVSVTSIGVRAYPMPATDYFSLDNLNGICDVELYSLSGEVVAIYRNVVAGQQMNCNELCPGVYSVVITDKTGKKTSVPLITQ